jgi:hypothetical protein
MHKFIAGTPARSIGYGVKVLDHVVNGLGFLYGSCILLGGWDPLPQKNRVCYMVAYTRTQVRWDVARSNIKPPTVTDQTHMKA